MLNHVVRAWQMTRSTTRDARARGEGKIRLLRALVKAALVEGCSREEALAARRFLETVARLPPALEEEYQVERNQFMMRYHPDFTLLTYSEQKAFREGEQKGQQEGRQEGLQEGRREAQRESARRMRDMGLDVKTIARALGLTQKKVASLLEAPPPPGD